MAQIVEGPVVPTTFPLGGRPQRIGAMAFPGPLDSAAPLPVLAGTDGRSDHLGLSGALITGGPHLKCGTLLQVGNVAATPTCLFPDQIVDGCIMITGLAASTTSVNLFLPTGKDIIRFLGSQQVPLNTAVPIAAALNYIGAGSSVNLTQVGGAGLNYSPPLLTYYFDCLFHFGGSTTAAANVLNIQGSTVTGGVVAATFTTGSGLIWPHTGAPLTVWGSAGVTVGQDLALALTGQTTTGISLPIGTQGTIVSTNNTWRFRFYILNATFGAEKILVVVL